MSDFCPCAKPWISEDKCERCNKIIDPARMSLIKSSQIAENSENQGVILEVEQMIPKSEEIVFSCDSSIKGRKSSDANFVGKVVVTGKNVYLLKRKFKAFGKPEPLTKESMPISQITGIDHTFEKYLTVKSHHVRITRANNEDVLYGLSEDNAIAIVENVQNQMNNASNSATQVIMSSDPIEQLTKLAALLEKGFITQEEFNKKKQELL